MNTVIKGQEKEGRPLSGNGNALLWNDLVAWVEDQSVIFGKKARKHF